MPGSGRALSDSPTAPKRKRPASVTLVAALALLVALYSLTYGILTMAGLGDEPVASGIFRIALGVGALAAAVGALRMRPWGWALFMTWNVIGLTHQVLRYLFFEDPNYVDMAINTFVVLALSPLEVQIAFGLRHTENVQLARSTRNPVDSA